MLDDVHRSLLITRVGVQIFWVLPNVVGNQRTCNLNDALRTYAALDECVIVRVLMTRWIFYDSFWIGMPEAVNGLVFVSDDGHVRIACKQINQSLVCFFQVLILINENMRIDRNV